MNFTRLFSYGVVGILMRCSADTAALNQCQIDCSKAKIPGPELIVKRLFADTATWTCPKGYVGPVPNPTLITFSFYYPPKADADPLATNAAKKSTPVGGVKFTPVIVGSLAATKTNPEFLGNNQYSGVSTPSSEWCSDSCGIAQLQVFAQCVGLQNDTVIGLRAGGAANSSPGTQDTVKISTAPAAN